MKRGYILINIFILIFSLIFISCSGDDYTGVFKIKLHTPAIGACVESFKDNCIYTNDKIELSIFTKNNLDDEYELKNRIPLDGPDNDDQIESYQKEFIRTLSGNKYYRLFVRIINDNEVLKFTGSANGIYYDPGKNYNIDIFLAPAGDYAKIESKSNFLDTHLYNSSGASAVAFKNSKVIVAGGRDGTTGVHNKETTMVNMTSVSTSGAKDLPEGLSDSAAALLDDASVSGKAVFAFGKTDNGYSSNVYIFDPEKNRYTRIPVTGFSGAHAAAITIDGDVYIVGGCNDTQASNTIIKINKEDMSHDTNVSALKTPRCRHAVTDASYIDSTGKLIKRIAVFGGQKKAGSPEFEDMVTGNNFFEMINITENETKTFDNVFTDDEQINITNVAAMTFRWDNINKGPDHAFVLVGGAHYPSSTDNWDNNNYSYTIIPSGDTYTVSKSKIVLNCPAPSGHAISSQENNMIQYGALNCGTNDHKVLFGNNSSLDQQRLYTIEARSQESEGDFNISISTTTGSFQNMVTSDSIGYGPLTVDPLGNAFAFGSPYIYIFGGFEPGFSL